VLTGPVPLSNGEWRSPIEASAKAIRFSAPKGLPETVKVSKGVKARSAADRQRKAKPPKKNGKFNRSFHPARPPRFVIE
jgi:hypothetical protein